MFGDAYAQCKLSPRPTFLYFHVAYLLILLQERGGGNKKHEQKGGEEIVILPALENDYDYESKLLHAGQAH